MSALFVDWITANLPFETMGVDVGLMALASDIERFSALILHDVPKRAAVPHNGYTQAWQLRSGTFIQFNGNRPEMGVNMVCSGQALAHIGWRQPLKLAVDRGSVSRLDVTIDVNDVSFDLEALYKLVDSGSCQTKARNCSFITSKTGKTLYVGKRSADRMLRIYDKGGELGGTLGEHWRIEAEIKGRPAMATAKRLLAEEQDGYKVFASILACPLHKGYSDAIKATVAEKPFDTDKRRRDTESWLFGLVAKVMADHERLNPGALVAFNETVRSLI